MARSARQRAELGSGRARAFLWAEAAALFLAMPVVLRIVHARHAAVPVIPVLVLAGLVVAVTLTRDPGFDHREALRWRWDAAERRRVLLLFVPATLALVAYTWLFHRQSLFGFPRERTGLWLAVMTFYPLLSVVPQELLFRVFFFHRYAPLLGRGTAMIAGSALAFGLAHLLFGNLLAVVLSGLGGALFGVTYARTRSLWLASFEHALYGGVIWTVGLGRFFYAGSDLARPG